MGWKELFGKAPGGGLGGIKRLKELRSGMTQAEVTALLGEPKQVQRFDEKLVWTYSLHQWMKGFVPCHLAFSGEPGTLTAWVIDEAQYQRDQQQWMAALAQLKAAGGSGGGSSANADIAANQAWSASGAGNWQSR